MLTKELEALKQTEQLCRELLAQAETQRLQIEADARQEAQCEYQRQEESARREGAARLDQARADAAAAKQAFLQARDAEIAQMKQQYELRIPQAATTLMERMCSGNDCAHEPLPPSGA